MTSEGREEGEVSVKTDEVQKTTVEVKAEAMVEGDKKEKVPKHRRSWESQDCSCSKVGRALGNFLLVDPPPFPLRNCWKVRQPIWPDSQETFQQL